MLLIFLLGAIFSFLYVRYTKSVFQSRSIIKYDIKQVSPVFNTDQIQADNYSYLSGEIELIKSNIIYDKVIQLLPLEVSYYAYGRINNTERYKNSPFLVKHFTFKAALYNKPFNIKILDHASFEMSYEINNKKFIENFNFGDIIDNEYFTFVIGRNENLTDTEIGNSFYFKINSKEQLENYLATNLTVKVCKR